MAGPPADKSSLATAGKLWNTEGISPLTGGYTQPLRASTTKSQVANVPAIALATAPLTAGRAIPHASATVSRRCRRAALRYHPRCRQWYRCRAPGLSPPSPPAHSRPLPAPYAQSAANPPHSRDRRQPEGHPGECDTLVRRALANHRDRFPAAPQL